MAKRSHFVVRQRPALAGRGSRYVWAGSGFVLGSLITLLALILLAPAPAQKVPVPSASTGIVVTIDDASLSHVIADGLAQANVPFHTSNIQAHIRSGNMVDITGDATVPILGTRQLEATGQLSVTSGHLSMHLTRGSIGGLDLPAPVVSVIESALDNEFVQLGGMLILGGNRYVVRGVGTTDGLLTLTLGNH